MADPSPVPAWQQAIRDRCVHPTGRFVAFPPEDVEGTLPARFARQARTHADRLAVRSDRHELTYRDLSRAATSVARLLRRRRGAGPGAVAVLCEPGAPAVWSALGAMAAGTMCVPLDPTHPRARISFILDDSGGIDRVGVHDAFLEPGGDSTPAGWSPASSRRSTWTCPYARSSSPRRWRGWPRS